MRRAQAASQSTFFSEENAGGHRHTETLSASGLDLGRNILIVAEQVRRIVGLL